MEGRAHDRAPAPSSPRTDEPPPPGSPPPLPESFLPRPRLARRWEALRGRRLILVTAGAGFGKTTFLASQTREDGRDLGWLELDAADAAPDAFAARLLPALERRPGLLVVDDAQVLAGAAESLRFLERALRGLPDRATLVLASREPLRLPQAKLRAQGVAAALTARDLAFTEEEVDALFRHRFPGSELDRTLCRRIVRQTEGWAAGIEILLQAAGGPSDWAIERALDRLSQAGSGWFDYFAEEVVSRLDAEMQQFLLRSSVLPRCDPALCDAALGTDDSSARLGELAARSLFTYATDSKGSAYRYHHVFQEFLRNQLQQRVGEAEIRRLHLRAARALVQAGDWAEAAAAFVLGGEVPSALRLIERHGEALLAAGRHHALLQLLNGVPLERMRRRPAVLSVLGRMQEMQGEWDQAIRTYRTAWKVVPAGPKRAEFEVLLAQIHLHRGEYERTEALCRAALRRDLPSRTAADARIHGLLGLSAAEQGRIQEAERHLRQSLRFSRRAKDASGEGRALYLLAVNVHYVRGELRSARDGARQALVVFRRLDDQRRIGHTLGILGFLAMASAQEHAARDLTESALRVCEGIGYRLVEGYCRYTLGKCALLARDPLPAVEHFEAARAIGDELREPALLTLPYLGLGEAALARGNRQAARVFADRAVEAARARGDGFQEAAGLVLRGLAVPSAAPSAWRRAESLLRAMGARLELHRLLLYRLDEGRVRARDRSARLAELLEGAARFEHEFLFLELEPDRAARVLPSALRAGIEADFAAAALLRLGERAVPALQRLLEEPDEDLRARVVDLLAKIGGHGARRALSRAARATTAIGRAAMVAAEELALTPAAPLSIRAFGPFELRAGDTLLSKERRCSIRALRFLQLLLVHRFRWVPKDVVLETLWPEGDPRKSENSLRQSVLLLRQALEPGLEETRFSRYVRFRSDAYRLDPGEGYEYDVEAFERRLRAGRRLWDEGRRAAALPHLRSALDLYRGPFLSEYPYEELLAPERERLAEECKRAIERVLECANAAGRWEEAVPLARSGMALDPFHEEFHWSLARALLRLGHRREAMAACESYEERMRRELDLPLPARMLELLALARRQRLP